MSKTFELVINKANSLPPLPQPTTSHYLYYYLFMLIESRKVFTQGFTLLTSIGKVKFKLLMHYKETQQGTITLFSNRKKMC